MPVTASRRTAIDVRLDRNRVGRAVHQRATEQRHRQNVSRRGNTAPAAAVELGE